MRKDVYLLCLFWLWFLAWLLINPCQRWRHCRWGSSTTSGIPIKSYAATLCSKSPVMEESTVPMRDTILVEGSPTFIFSSQLLSSMNWQKAISSLSRSWSFLGVDHRWTKLRNMLAVGACHVSQRLYCQIHIMALIRLVLLAGESRFMLWNDMQNTHINDGK